MKLSRREFLSAASALLLSQAVASTPSRLKRKDCFFGLHFDLHPTPNDTALGRDLTDAMVGHLLESCRPDFIQYDSKGHPGYLGFPSKTGMSVPGIVQDSLAVWRRVTAAHGVALYNHFSGVLDGLAVTKHPEWARIGPDGQPDPQETSLFSGYDRELMIPELAEAALQYDLDGSWVDGECWAVKPDYCKTAETAFLERTGFTALPKTPQDEGWNEFLQMQREQFRRHVARYVEALHQAKPGYEITSNWMYSTFVPERPEVALDYLSGDLADLAPIRQARIQARYLSCCDKPWDLMSWGFEHDAHFSSQSAKPAVELEQEAAIVLAQGGAFQIYYVPTRSGWIDDRVIKTASEVAKFCRQRQIWSHGSESIPEVGVYFSGRTLYRTAGRVFGGWGDAEAPVAGAVDLLLSCGYSVDLIPDWQAVDSATRYAVIVVPDWQDIGEEAVETLTRYVAGGGKLMLCGAENACLFSKAFDLAFIGTEQQRTYFVADDSGFAQVRGNWMEIVALEPQIAARAYRAPDTRKDAFPLAVRVQHGKGSVIVCPGPIASSFGNASTPILRSVVHGIMEPWCEPMVRLDGNYPALEVVLRKKNSQMMIHLINTVGMPDTDEFRDQGVVAPTGPIHLQIRLPKSPSHVALEPDGITLAGEYFSTQSSGGLWRGMLPDLQIHSIVRVDGGV